MKPEFENDGWETLPPAALRLWQINSIIGNVLLAAVIALACSGVFVEWRLSSGALASAAAAVGVLAGIEIAWLLPKRYRNACWRVGVHGLEVRRGALVRRERLYPMSAVLFVERRSNPVSRHFGLVSVHVHDITGSHEFGLTHEGDADRIIGFVACRPAR